MSVQTRAAHRRRHQSTVDRRYCGEKFKAITHLLGAVMALAGAAGGLFYAAGIAFHALDGRLKHAHGVRHPLVLAASVSHHFVILHYVQ
ncbi:MAG TPA: hypothetical protein VMT92_00980 [Steroidobacteraceae bacterium]|nr:hypothetical protein [Steroidobacteraceae bacterium]